MLPGEEAGLDSHAGHATLPSSRRHPSASDCAPTPSASSSGATNIVDADSNMLAGDEVIRCQ